MNKIFIKTDQYQKTEFLSGLQDTITKGNLLIQLYNDHQPFKRIDSMVAFVELCHDPVRYFDDTLISNIQHDERLSVNPDKLAELYGIPRKDYLVALGMTPAQASKCVSCGEPKDTTIQLKCLSVEQYDDNSAFLMFKSGRVQSNPPLVEKHLETFNVYAVSEEAVKLVQHYQNLCKTLNEAVTFHKLGSVQIQNLAKIFGLLILDNKLIVNDIELANKIKFLQ